MSIDSFDVVATHPEGEPMSEKSFLTPYTRRLIVMALALIALVAIACEVALRLNDKESSEALLGLAAVAVGALGGMAVPHSPSA
jgi:hypothetical protein